MAIIDFPSNPNPNDTYLFNDVLWTFNGRGWIPAAPASPSSYSGYSGYSGISGYSGSGISGYSGYSGSGISGYSGYSGSGISGYSGWSGYSGVSSSFSIVTKTSNYTATTSDYTILVDASGGTVDILMPSSPTTGQILNVKKVDSSVNTVTITRAGSQTIDGATGQTIYYQYDSYCMQYNGTDWYII